MRLMVADEWRRAVGTGGDGREDLVCDVVAEHLVVVARREHRVVELDEDPHEKLLARAVAMMTVKKSRRSHPQRRRTTRRASGRRRRS